MTDQEIDISDSSDQAESVGRGIDDIQSCLDGLPGALSDGTAAASERISTCQETANRVAGQMDGTTVDVAQSELQVRISPQAARTRSWSRRSSCCSSPRSGSP